jgi:DNA-binding NarL/FixJ family response regulator
MRRKHAASPISSLADLDRDILALLAEGLSSVGIAQRLAVDAEIVESRIAEVFARLGLSAERDADRRAETVVRYLEAR